MSYIPPDVPAGFASPFVTDNYALGSQQAFTQLVNFNIVVSTVLPYPTPNSMGSAELLVWRWAVVINPSPSVLFVFDSLDNSRPIGTIAPFSADRFALTNAANVGGMSVIAFGPGPGQLVVTWYVDKPDGSYPSGNSGGGGSSSSSPITLADTARTFALGAGPFSFNMNASANFQSAAISILQTGGTATGFQVTVSLGGTVMYSTMYPPGAFPPFWIVPFLGGAAGLAVTITPILSKVAGGTAALTVNVTYLQSLVPKPYLAGGATAHVGQFGGPVLGINSGATATVLADPPTGYCWRLRNIMGYYATAPAAVQTVVLSGVSSAAAVYEIIEVPATATTIPGVGARNYLLNNAISRLDQAEGLTVKNNASQTLTFWCTADLINYPQVASDLSG